jgi:hypothetical protein
VAVRRRAWTQRGARRNTTKLFNVRRILRDVLRKRHECALQPKTL